MAEKILAQAAEAVIIQDKDKIIKRRISKGYRLQVLDLKLRKLRTRSEAKIMEKLSSRINVPKIISVDESSKEIVMEFIQGKKLSDSLESLDWEKIAIKLGQEIAKIHDLDLIHGDLTTSNLIYVDNSELNDKTLETQGKSKPIGSINKANESEAPYTKPSSVINSQDNNFKIFFIDFGLGYHSSRLEDKAVDLHLIKQALEAKHFTIFQDFFRILLENYSSKDKLKTLEQLKKVEARGRYKH